MPTKMESDDDRGPLTWSTELENFIKNTGDQANGLAWLHKRSESYFSTRKNFIELPVIVLSSVVGFCSVGSDNIFQGRHEIAQILLGALSLLVSVLNTINSYFAWAKRSEGHRIAAIHYDRLHRFIAIELSLPRVERMSPIDLLKHVRESVDRLAEISPIVAKPIVVQYQNRFLKRYANQAHPSEVNGLTPINVVRDTVHASTPTVRPRSVGRPDVIDVDSGAFAAVHPSARVLSVDAGVAADVRT